MISNPFLISGYHSPSYFCDREEESSKIISALTNDRNLTLISPRRMGKTGLIHHCFHLIQAENSDIYCFYLDIFSTQNLHDFVDLFAKTVIGKLDNYSESTIKKLFSFLKSFRPSLTFDPISGTPTINFDIIPLQEENSLKEIFSYLEETGKRCYIAIDEFQQIIEYPEKGVEALLRSYIQFIPNVKFIFSGSKKHLMDEMFSSINRPFYQSTQKIGLKEIPLESYYIFAAQFFSAVKKNLPYEVFEYIYSKMFGHTWYIQYVLNQLYSMQQLEYTISDIELLIDSILEEENATYKTYCEMITKGQLKLLTAIAKEKRIKSPYETRFMRLHKLSAISSVKLALHSLIEKTLILKDEEEYYFVYDRFFSLWLEKR